MSGMNSETDHEHLIVLTCVWARWVRTGRGLLRFSCHLGPDLDQSLTPSSFQTRHLSAVLPDYSSVFYTYSRTQTVLGPTLDQSRARPMSVLVRPSASNNYNNNNKGNFYSAHFPSKVEAQSALQ